MGRSEAAQGHDATVRNTYVIMACTFASRILGIVRVSAVSAIFGASGTADIINFTFNIPNNFRKLLAEGALSNAYIPVLSKALSEDEESGGHEAPLLVRNMIGLQAVILIPVIIGVLLFGEQIIAAISGFTDPEALRLSGRLLGYFSIYLLLISVIAVISSTLHCRSAFTVAAVAPLTFSVAVIGALLLFGRGGNPYVFAAGVVIGGILHLLILQPAFRREGFSILPGFSRRSPYLRQVLTYWLPVMVTSSIAIINQQVAYFLASGLQEGSVTAFSNSIIFWQLPYGLFFSAIATVYFPKMSRAFHRHSYDELKQEMVGGLKHLMVFIIPSIGLLLISSGEFVSAILYRGAYTLENTLLTAKTVRMFAVGLYSVAGYNFLLKFFYSIGSYRVTLISSVIVAALDIAASVAAVAAGLDVSFLALANSLSFTVGIIYLIVYIQLKTAYRLELLPIVGRFVKITLLCLPAVAASRVLPLALGSWVGNGSSLGSMLLTTANSLVFGVVVLLSYRIGKIEISWRRRRRQ